jgi:mono/diheme cytochrome c family protein
LIKGETMKKSIFAVILVLTILARLPVFAAGDAAAGKDAYMKKCASCHGSDGLGKDQIAQMMKIKFTPLGAKEVQAKSDADLKKIAIEGGGKMKAVKDVDDKMAEDIVAFLRTFAKK